MEQRVRVIDLFAGCGGFSVGFEQAGYEITKAVEFDKAIAMSYSINHLNTIVYAEDIGTIVDNDHFNFNEAEVIIGGPPCQGFSMAGERIRERKAFINDPRNYLFRHYVEVVNIVRPKVFVLENVKGILSKDNGAIFREVVDAFGNPKNFDGDKYYLHYKVCKAVDYGIPQRRERVVIIGMLNKDFDMNELFDITKREMDTIDNNFFSPVTLRDAISDFPEPTSDGIVHLKKTISYYQRCLRNEDGIVTNHNASNHNALAIKRMKKVSSGEN